MYRPRAKEVASAAQLFLGTIDNSIMAIPNCRLAHGGRNLRSVTPRLNSHGILLRDWSRVETAIHAIPAVLRKPGLAEATEQRLTPTLGTFPDPRALMQYQGAAEVAAVLSTAAQAVAAEGSWQHDDQMPGPLQDTDIHISRVESPAGSVAYRVKIREIVMSPGNSAFTNPFIELTMGGGQLAFSNQLEYRLANYLGVTQTFGGAVYITAHPTDEYSIFDRAAIFAQLATLPGVVAPAPEHTALQAECAAQAVAGGWPTIGVYPTIGTPHIVLGVGCASSEGNTYENHQWHSWSHYLYAHNHGAEYADDPALLFLVTSAKQHAVPSSLVEQDIADLTFALAHAVRTLIPHTDAAA